MLGYLDYGKPYFLLRENSVTYSNHYIDCEQAQKSKSELSSGVVLSPQGANQLSRSLEIEKLSCDEKELLQQELLSAGVKLEQVKVLELNAAMRNL